MEASRKTISRDYATSPQRKLHFGTGRTGEARTAAEAADPRGESHFKRPAISDRLIHRTVG
jgi:hypothetical protein